MTLQPAPRVIISLSPGNEGGNVKLPAKSFQLDIWTGEERLKTQLKDRTEMSQSAVKKKKSLNTIVMAQFF